MWFLDWVTRETRVASRLDLWRIRVVSRLGYWGTRVASRLDLWRIRVVSRLGH